MILNPWSSVVKTRHEFFVFVLVLAAFLPGEGMMSHPAGDGEGPWTA